MAVPPAHAQPHSRHSTRLAPVLPFGSTLRVSPNDYEPTTSGAPVLLTADTIHNTLATRIHSSTMEPLEAPVESHEVHFVRHIRETFREHDPEGYAHL